MQRGKWTRENNTLIAARLLPIFEAEPAGWDTLPFINLGKRDPKKTFAEYLREWSANARPAQRAFIAKIAAVFPGVKL